MKTKSTQPASFEIRTLRDIFNLPTMEQMETCLEEIARGMKQARSTSDLLIATVEALGGTAPDQACEWPEMVEWTDDGKGRVECRFEDLLSVVTLKE